MEEFEIINPDWRNGDNNTVMLNGGFLVQEKEIYLAVEKLTPYLQIKYGRNPTQEDIISFIYAISGVY